MLVNVVLLWMPGKAAAAAIAAAQTAERRLEENGEQLGSRSDLD